MKRHFPALAVSLILFVGWLIYLGTQAWQYRKPQIIVSRAQLLAAQYDVAADLTSGPSDKPAARIKVTEVLHTAEKDGPAVGQEIGVLNLDECTGFVGPGTYVLPLAKRGPAYQVAAPPMDPGVSRRFRPTIYPLNDRVRKQFADLRSGANP